MAGGLVAAWVMNQFMAGPGQKLQEAVQAHELPNPSEDATMKAAEAFVHSPPATIFLRAREEKGRSHRALCFWRADRWTLRRSGRVFQ